MIELSNGHKFEYRAASGALKFDGRGWFWEWPLRWVGIIDPKLFTVVIKTLTYAPRKGNLRWYKPWDCVKLLEGGVLNAVGLTNPGVIKWSQQYGSRINSQNISTMGSIMSLETDTKKHVDELKKMAIYLNDFNFVGLEVNGSCPNTGEDIVKNTDKVIAGIHEVKKYSRFPLILKVSVTHDDGQTLEKIIDQTKRIVEAYSINSVLWKTVYNAKTSHGEKISPLAKFGGGGVSGKLAQEFTWPLVNKLSKLSTIPVCGPSVWDYIDLHLLRNHNASAIDFGSIFLRHPSRPTDFVKRDMLENR